MPATLVKMVYVMKNGYEREWVLWVDFTPFFTRETTVVTPVFFSAQQSSSEKRSILKGKYLLPRSKFFPFRVDLFPVFFSAQQSPSKKRSILKKKKKEFAPKEQILSF